MRRAVIAIAIVGSLVALVISYQPSKNFGHLPSDAEIELLASDAYVNIGDVLIILPYIALPDFVSMGQFFSLDRRRAREEWVAQRDEFRAAASYPETAPTLGQLEVIVDNFGGNGLDEICQHLSRNWARSVCDNPWAPILQALPPNRFRLADDRRIDSFDHHWTVGRERVSDHLQAMDLQSNEASIVCGERSSSTTRFCTAAMRLEDHLIAVWTVWDSEKEPSVEQAKREGKAINAFVRHALGPTENFRELSEVMCHLGRPGHSTRPDSRAAC